MTTERPLAIGEIASQLDAVALPLARRRLEEMGLDASGSYRFYAERIAQGTLFAGCEIALVERLLADPESPQRFHELGGGFGTLSWLLGASGRQVTCFEYDRRRYVGAVALLNELVRSRRMLARRIKIARLAFPPPEPPASGIWLLATNMVATFRGEERERLLARLGDYDRAVIDMDRFLDPAPDDLRRAERIGEVESAGLSGQPYLIEERRHHFYSFSRR